MRHHRLSSCIYTGQQLGDNRNVAHPPRASKFTTALCSGAHQQYSVNTRPSDAANIY